QASETPDGIAVEMGDQALSYAELDAWSSRVAAGLRKRGIGREAVVGLYVSRSVEMVVCLLGIMKAGGAYLSLDPGYPSHRIAYLVKDSGVSLIVTEKSLLSSLPASGAQVVLLEEVLSAPEIEMVEEAGSSEDLAYLIYTSGSTGEPKGTEVPQGALVNLLWSMLHEPGLGRGDTLVAVTTLSFDIAGLEIWGPLVSGAKLVVASREEALDPQALAELMDRSGCTVLQATPSTWRMLVESGWMGKSDLRMWSGGEGLRAELADSLLTRGRELWNLYGPTETTIWSAAHRVSSGEDPILIGRPIANTRMYILDESGEPVPVGVAGELYIAGEGVARGYRKRDELTAERFVPERFVSGGRMYRTGDLARYRRDGEIQLLGRTDEQIKLRGHRIEPGEIEAVLEKHASVQQAIVTVQRERLVAYVRSVHGEAEGAELRSWLQERLPEYMVPGVYVHVEELPLTPNGKVDRKRLPAIEEGLQEERGESVAPRTATEQRLAAIWSQVLGSSVPGTRDNFFDLGGHSLLLIRVHAQLREEFDLDIPILDLFRFTTIQALASHLNQKMQPAVAGGVHF
ncbi:amino acid adenylation domain-containing protein, partial [Acidobacterium sp. S8]|uniref:non-ribosomal peptide synthetase n=1 Tax=Acidobacterium sp. S8 TaxID=1641854 RepID=UPI001C205151